MIKLVGITACILALVGLSGCADNSPVEVRLKENPLSYGYDSSDDWGHLNGRYSQSQFHHD
jgi:hypothetical protein